MHATILRPSFTRPVDDAEARRALDLVIPECQRAAGFHGIYSIRINQRQIVNVFLWDSLEASVLGLQAARQVAVPFFGPALAGPPECLAGEVIRAQLAAQQSRVVSSRSGGMMAIRPRARPRTEAQP